MKQVTVKRLSDQADELLDAAQIERIVVTRNGRPSAVLLGIEFKDEEDYALERDTEFWRMIEERRKETKFHTLEEVKKRLGMGSRKTTNRRPPSTGKKRKTVP
jgi:prevent-host-death family protein